MRRCTTLTNDILALLLIHTLLAQAVAAEQQRMLGVAHTLRLDHNAQAVLQAYT